MLIDMLKSGIVNIDFEKIDGTRRIIRQATLSLEYVSQADQEVAVKANRIHVWDIDDAKWKTIITDNINAYHQA